MVIILVVIINVIGSSRRGRPKRDEPEEENEVDTDNKAESKAEEKKEQKEENGKVEETDQKENNVDDTDGGGDAKSMEVDESDTLAPVDGEKPTDNGPSEHPSSPVQKEVFNSFWLIYSNDFLLGCFYGCHQSIHILNRLYGFKVVS